jgi:hypothetical protein
MTAQQIAPEMLPTMRNEESAPTTTTESDAGTTSRSASGSGGPTLHGERDIEPKRSSTGAAPARRHDAGEKGQPRRSEGKDQVDGQAKKTGLAKLEDKMPDWLSKAIRTPRMWKNFTRCMIATFATLILLLAQKCESRVPDRWAA